MKNKIYKSLKDHMISHLHDLYVWEEQDILDLNHVDEREFEKNFDEIKELLIKQVKNLKGE